MLKGIMKYRPTNLYAVYVENRRIEVLRAHRRWRSWELEAAEQYPVPAGESALDHLQYLNLRPKSRKGSALLLILPSNFYSVHREHYPVSLKDQLDEAVNFDWQENIFHEEDRTIHFFGPSLPINQYVSVPIFSIQREIYDKLHQALNGSLFHTFTVMPSSLLYGSFLPSLTTAEEGDSLELIARSLDDAHLEVHRFYKGSFMDTLVIGKSLHSLRLFRENLRCISNGDSLCEIEPHIHLLCLDEECGEAEDYGKDWVTEGFPIQVHKLEESFVSNWVRHLLGQETIFTFDTELLLKPWEVPRVIWPLLFLVLVFAAYGLYQVRSVEQLTQTNKRLRIQVNQLETKWKPIEELQTRISKFREDQKTLSEFNREGYPLLELLTFLTQITPDDTWLNYLSLRKSQLIIRGESKSAIKYLSELSKTEGLSDVKFASPVTRNPSSDQERFNVQLNLDIEKLHKGFEALPAETVEDAATPAAIPASINASQAPVRAAPEVNSGDEQPAEEEVYSDDLQSQEEAQ